MPCQHESSEHRRLQLMDAEGWCKHCNTYIAKTPHSTPTLTGIATNQGDN